MNGLVWDNQLQIYYTTVVCRPNR